MLKDDPMFRAQVIGVLSEVLITKAEFTQMLDELRAMRLESERRFDEVNERLEAHDRRFDAVDQRLEAHDRRFDAVDHRLDAVDHRLDAVDHRLDAVDHRLEALDWRFDRVDEQFDAVRAENAKILISVGALGGRMGRKLEDVIRQVIEHYSGLGPLKAERLTLIDETGECLHPGATVEFDALVTNGHKFLVEVKSYAKPGDVSAFHRQACFAEAKLGETFEKVLIAPSATPAAVALAKQLGIICHTFSVEE
jgi:hypothetical protein